MDCWATRFSPKSIISTSPGLSLEAWRMTAGRCPYLVIRFAQPDCFNMFPRLEMPRWTWIQIVKQCRVSSVKHLYATVLSPWLFDALYQPHVFPACTTVSTRYEVALNHNLLCPLPPWIRRTRASNIPPNLDLVTRCPLFSRVTAFSTGLFIRMESLGSAQSPASLIPGQTYAITHRKSILR